MIAEGVIAALLVLSGLFGLTAAIGLLRLPDTLSRLHAPTLAATLGTGLALVASMLHQWTQLGTISLHEPLITLFLLMSAPLTALMIARVHLHHRQTAKPVPAQPHPPGPDDSPPVATGRDPI